MRLSKPQPPKGKPKPTTDLELSTTSGAPKISIASATGYASKSKTVRLAAKLKSIPKFTIEAVHSAMRKVARSCGMSPKDSSKSVDTKRSLLSPSRRFMKKDGEVTAPFPDVEHTITPLENPECSSSNSVPPRDNEEDDNSEMTDGLCLASCGPLPSHDPGYTPSPYPFTSTSMEVCEWAASRNIAAGMFWTRFVAAGGEVREAIPRRASCLNRADNHIYDVPLHLNIRLPLFGTGQKTFYLVNGPPNNYPRGAKGFKKPADTDFPSWCPGPDGLVPTERHPRGVFIPARSRMNQVETLEYGEDKQGPITPLGPFVTGRSHSRTKAIVTRQLGQDTTPSATTLPTPTLRFKSCAEEERADDFLLEQAGLRDRLASLKIDEPIVKQVAGDEQLSASGVNDSTSALTYSSINWVVHGSGSEESGSESYEDDVSSHDITDPGKPQVNQATLPRSTGQMNIPHSHLVNSIAATIQEEEEQVAEEDMERKTETEEERETESGSEEDGETAKLVNRLYDILLYDDEADEAEAVGDDTDDESVSSDLEIDDNAIVKYLFDEHIKQPSTTWSELVESRSSNRKPEPSPSPFSNDEPLRPGQVFFWQKPGEKIVFRMRPAPPQPLEDIPEGDEDEVDDEATQLPDISKKSALNSPGNNKFTESGSGDNMQGLGNTSLDGSHILSVTTMDNILVQKYEGDNKSECDGDAFSISSDDLHEDQDATAHIPSSFVDQSTVIHHDDRFGNLSFLEATPVKLRPSTEGQLADIVLSIEEFCDHDDCQILLPCRRPNLPIGLEYAKEKVNIIDEGPHLIVPMEGAVVSHSDFSVDKDSLASIESLPEAEEGEKDTEESSGTTGEEQKYVAERWRPSDFGFFYFDC